MFAGAAGVARLCMPEAAEVKLGRMANHALARIPRRKPPRHRD
jgi:hypothetical protein